MVRCDESVTFAMTEVNGAINGIEVRLLMTDAALTLDKLTRVDNASESVVVRLLSADELTCC